MTQEDKELLLKDLCARLPHKVIIKSIGENKIIGLWDLRDIDNLPLPYLRPMSSMTEEEIKEFNNIPSTKNYQIVKGDLPWDVANYKQIGWLLKNHFDFMGLISKGLAIEVPEGMYNKNLQNMPYKYFPSEFSSYEDYVKYLKEKGFAIEAPKENKVMIQEFKTRTGAIYCDTEKKMEYLYVGDYGKENNIKADFLGFKKEINQVPHHEVDLSEKMVVTISTQKGCPMNCMFCDCPKVKFGGNISREELAEEVTEAIKRSGCSYTQRFNLHLARMGEPALNAVNVLTFLKEDLVPLVNGLMKADTIHPVFTTMCPKGVGKERLLSILSDFCRLKNLHYKGEAGLQLSINSTDETQRNQLFRGMSLSLADISEITKELPMPNGRKYTLNFPVTDKTILDPKELSRLFDKGKFIVKITPIHETNEANANGINTPDGYYKYDVYRQFEQPLLDEGWDVIVFIPSKEEDEDRITCGNALLYEQKLCDCCGRRK